MPVLHIGSGFQLAAGQGNALLLGQEGPLHAGIRHGIAGSVHNGSLQLQGLAGQNRGGDLCRNHRSGSDSHLVGAADAAAGGGNGGLTHSNAGNVTVLVHFGNALIRAGPSDLLIGGVVGLNRGRKLQLVANSHFLQAVLLADGHAGNANGVYNIEGKGIGLIAAGGGNGGGGRRAGSIQLDLSVCHCADSGRGDTPGDCLIRGILRQNGGAELHGLASEQGVLATGDGHALHRNRRLSNSDINGLHN